MLRRHWRSISALTAGGLAAATLAVVSGASAGERPASGAAAPTAAMSPSTAVSRTAPLAPAAPFSMRLPLSARPRLAASGARTASDDARPPNIVYVLTDDLSMDLLRFMPQVQAMQSRGVTFKNFFVSDSLCCPSRSTIFTGNFPHDTGVYTNTGRDGGIRAFYGHADENRSFNVYLQQAGYRTGFMGKYLNGYLQGPSRSPVPSTYVPPGWDEWDGAGWGYPEFDYHLNQDGRLHYYGHQPQDYLTNVIARRGARFVRNSAATGRPFFLELATFAPHQPYTPAPRYANSFPGLKAPRPAAFDKMPTHPPQWLRGHLPLNAGNIRYINKVFRKRVQAVQSVDDLITRIRTALQATGQLKNTYIVFSSDNGLHTGEYRLMPGKLTAFNTDIHTPLVVDGPGVPAGAVTSGMAENTDMAKTFEQIAGTSAPCDGHSLLPLMAGGKPAGWRNAVLVEHHGPDLDNPLSGDPDGQDWKIGNPTTYEAMRTSGFLYVEYRDGEREYYDLRTDPAELHNIVSSLPPARLAELHSELSRLVNCHTGDSCWSAEHVSNNS